MGFERMFSPIQIGSVTVPNRFVVPPMGNNFANTDGTLSERSCAYYETRAKGGFGLITIEATVIDETAKGGRRKPCLFEDSTVESFRVVAEACHLHGAKVSVQLQHAGPEGDPEVTGYPLKAASAVVSSRSKAVPQEITVEELETLIEKYGDAALRAKTAGIDMVELHCAHGYLLHSFLSSRTNHRTDEYGGCLENRLRLIRRIIENIRSKVGDAYPILCRINACDDVPGGLTVEDSAVIAMYLEGMGVDGIHVSRAVHLRDDKMWATSMSHDAFSGKLVGEIKSSVSIPIIAVGRFTDPAYGELLLKQGKADMIAFGRQSIADPNLPVKAKMGHMDEIYPCIGCLQGCVPNMMTGQPITCLVNPFVGKEAHIGQQASQKKNVTVIGGGVGGLVAARICAERGHDVTLYEAQPQLGGQMRAASVPPGKGNIAEMIRAGIRACENSGAKICCNTKVTTEMLETNPQEVLLIAAGAVPAIPKIPGVENECCVTAMDVLLGKASCGKRVLIIGGGMVGCETAAFLGERQYEVTILEQRDEIGIGVQAEHGKVLHELLEAYRVKQITNATVRQFINDGVIYFGKDRETKALTGFDTIVLATGSKSNTELVSTAKRVAKECYTIGDAVSPRHALEAIREGYIIAEKL